MGRTKKLARQGWGMAGVFPTEGSTRCRGEVGELMAQEGLESRGQGLLCSLHLLQDRRDIAGCITACSIQDAGLMWSLWFSLSPGQPGPKAPDVAFLCPKTGGLSRHPPTSKFFQSRPKVFIQLDWTLTWVLERRKRGAGFLGFLNQM